MALPANVEAATRAVYRARKALSDALVTESTTKDAWNAALAALAQRRGEVTQAEQDLLRVIDEEASP